MRSPIILSLTLCGLLHGLPGQAQQPPARTELEPDAATEGSAEATRPLPPPERISGVPLSESRAIALALKNNPSLQSARQRLASSKQEVRAEEGRYPYYLDANADYTRDEATQLLLDDSVWSTTTHSVGAGVGLRRQFPVGTVAQVHAGGTYFDVSDNIPDTQPQPYARRGYVSTLSASLTQPLLRGFGKRVGEADLRVARISRTAADRALARTKSALIADVSIAYAELWLALQVERIEAQSLHNAQEQEQRSRALLDLKSTSSVDQMTFETRVAEREEALIVARGLRRRRSIDLSSLLGDPKASENLLSTDTPNTQGIPLGPRSVEAAVKAHSVELAELEEQVKLAQAQAEVAGENLRSRLDLQGSVTSIGTSEEFPRAWERSARGSWWSAQTGLVLELPLDNQARHATEMQAQLAVQVAQQDLRAARDRTAAEARDALVRFDAAMERLATSRRATKIAERTYEAESERYALSQSIVIQLHDAEDAFRRAALREAQAHAEAAEARTLLLHLTGQLLATH